MSMKRRIRKMKDFDLDDVLGAFGLTRRRGVLGFVLPAVGLLAAGTVIGAGIALLFAPSSGRRLRADMGEKVKQLKERYVPEQVASSEINSVVPR